MDALIFKIRWSESVEERHLAAWVIMQIEGKEQAIFRLQTLAETASSETGGNEKEAVLYIKNFKPTFTPPASHTK